jgi:hypothetical protein
MEIFFFAPGKGFSGTGKTKKKELSEAETWTYPSGDSPLPVRQFSATEI